MTQDAGISGPASANLGSSIVWSSSGCDQYHLGSFYISMPRLCPNQLNPNLLEVGPGMSIWGRKSQPVCLKKLFIWKYKQSQNVTVPINDLSTWRWCVSDRPSVETLLEFGSFPGQTICGMILCRDAGPWPEPQRTTRQAVIRGKEHSRRFLF